MLSFEERDKFLRNDIIIDDNLCKPIMVISINNGINNNYYDFQNSTIYIHDETFKKDDMLLQYNIYIYDRKIKDKNCVLAIVEPKENNNNSKTYAHISFCLTNNEELNLATLLDDGQINHDVLSKQIWREIKNIIVNKMRKETPGVIWRNYKPRGKDALQMYKAYAVAFLSGGINLEYFDVQCSQPRKSTIKSEIIQCNAHPITLELEGLQNNQDDCKLMFQPKIKFLNFLNKNFDVIKQFVKDDGVFVCRNMNRAISEYLSLKGMASKTNSVIYLKRNDNECYIQVNIPRNVPKLLIVPDEMSLSTISVPKSCFVVTETEFWDKLRRNSLEVFDNIQTGLFSIEGNIGMEYSPYSLRRSIANHAEQLNGLSLETREDILYSQERKPTYVIPFFNTSNLEYSYACVYDRKSIITVILESEKGVEKQYYFDIVIKRGREKLNDSFKLYTWLCKQISIVLGQPRKNLPSNISHQRSETKPNITKEEYYRHNILQILELEKSKPGQNGCSLSSRQRRIARKKLSRTIYVSVILKCRLCRKRYQGLPGKKIKYYIKK